MSFSFTAAGDKKQVVAQLNAIADGKRSIGTGQLGTDLARLLAEHVNQDENQPGGYQYVYVVTASGHSGGGSAASLQCSVTPHWVLEEQLTETDATIVADDQDEIEDAVDGKRVAL